MVEQEEMNHTGREKEAAKTGQGKDRRSSSSSSPRWLCEEEEKRAGSLRVSWDDEGFSGTVLLGVTGAVRLGVPARCRSMRQKIIERLRKGGGTNGEVEVETQPECAEMRWKETCRAEIW